MEAALVRTPDKKQIEKLHVVRNFRAVIEARDISLMKDELYEFLTLHCGFIAHYNINGFKAAYSHPKDLQGSLSATLTGATVTFATPSTVMRPFIGTQATPRQRSRKSFSGSWISIFTRFSCGQRANRDSRG